MQPCFESLSSGGGVLVDCNLTVSYSCWTVYLSSVNFIFLMQKKKQIHSLTYCSLFELLLCFRTKQGARLSVVTIISPLICICED